MASPKTNLDVVFGAMTFGKEGTEQARVFNVDSCTAILDVFQKYGHKEIDTARFYAEGTSEEFLGELDWKSRGLVMDTKFFPTAGRQMSKSNAPEGGWRHTPEHIRQNLKDSLKALKCDKVDMWYLHGPDRTTPYEVTLRTVNELHQEGYFTRFGISNYMAWEVAQICEICTKNNWIKPTVYQGVYNALHRSVEPELFPCLRYYGISFYNYNPLAGGYLTSRYQRTDKDTDIEAGSRFDPKRWQGQSYRARYWNDAYFDALDMLRNTTTSTPTATTTPDPSTPAPSPLAAKFGLTEAECALRWMMHHSMMKREYGDKVIIGASSVGHLESNLGDMEKGALPEEVVKALDGGWERCKGVSAKYFI